MTPAALIDTIEFSPVPAPDRQTAEFLLHYVTHRGTLQIGNARIAAAILSNGQLVFYGDGLHAFFADVAEALEPAPKINGAELSEDTPAPHE